MKTLIKSTALALAASGMLASAAPAAAADFGDHRTSYRAAPAEDGWHKDRRDRRYDRYDRYERRNDRRDRRYNDRYAYGEPVYRNTQVWRGRDGNTYCRKKDGTTGLIVGAAAGALLGREVDKYGNRTTGTIIGGALGALLGKELTDGVRCR